MRDILKKIANIKGILPGGQTVSLIEAVLMASPGPRLEIGGLCGLSTCCIMLASSDDDKVITVDPFKIEYLSDMAKDVVASVSGVEALEKDSFYDSWRKQVDLLRGSSNIRSVCGDRLEVLPDVIKMLDGEELSFLFLDGLHGYTDVKQDIEAYLPLLKTDGIIVFHDYENKGVFGVGQAVDEFVNSGHIQTINSSYVFVGKKLK